MASDGHTSGERSEQPTGRRRDEARRQGRVAISHDLTAACALLGALSAYALVGGRLLTETVAMFAERLSTLPRADLTPDGALAMLAAGASSALRIAWPLVAWPAAVVIAAQLFQTRFAFAPEALSLKWNRLNPREGLARLLGLRGLVEMLKAVIKVVAVGGAALATVRADWTVMTGVTGGEAGLAALGRVVTDVWLRVGLAYLALAALDYGYQWWNHERSLRMTREEVRQESKETEGDPGLRARMRAVHRKMATRRMMAEVRRADVVLRNPTHVAVALRYEGGRMRAPRVVAKGEDVLAFRIIDVARRYGVPILENPPLARALNAAVKIGREIPSELYRAVAEVLAYVYALRGGVRR